MRRYFICLAFFLTLWHFAYCQNINTFIANLSQTENVEKVRIGRFFMSFANIAAKFKGMPGKIHSMEIYTLENCSKTEVSQYEKEIKAIKDENDYTSLIQVREGEDLVRIMVKKGKNKIRELIITCLDSKDLCVIRMKGKIKATDLDRLIKQHTD